MDDTQQKNRGIRRAALVGTAFAALAAIGFSTKAIFVKLAYQEPVDAVTLLTLRMVFSLPVFLVTGLFSRNPARPLEKQDWWTILALGLVGYYASSLLDFLGLRYISAGLERLILFLYPTMVMLMSAVLSRRTLRRREILALLLSYAGIALVFMQNLHLEGKGLVLGATLVFVSTLTYSVYLVGAGRAIARIGATRFTSFASIVSCFAVMAQFAVSHPLHLPPLSLRVYELGLAMAIFSTAIPFFLVSAGIRRIGSRKTALIGSLGPVTTLYLAHVFLGESFALQQILGSMLVMAGVLAISLKPRGA